MTPTAHQALALAPDAAAARAAAAVAVPRRWAALGGDGEGRAAWGECQGSGAAPYRTALALADGAARCTCPSRKLPCKHALGLFLLLAAEPELFAVAEPPAWVAEWLAGRAARAGRPHAATGSAAADAGADAESAEKVRRAATRADQRAEKAAAGLAELSAWLEDLVRAGVAAAPSRPSAFWNAAAARLVDAQVPGAARLVRQLAATAGADAGASGAAWPERFVAAASRLHLLARAYDGLGALPADLRADVRAALGLPPADEAGDGREVVADTWVALGQVTELEDRLRARRTWLAGRRTGRHALLLHYAHGDAPFAEEVPPAGGVLEGELAFLPGTTPLRAAVRARAADPSGEMPNCTPGVAPGGVAPGGMPSNGDARLADALRPWAGALARNPWTERVAVVLAAAVPEQRGDGWAVRDAAGDALPVAAKFRGGWALAALAGGRPVWIAAEWDGEALLPLAAAGADGVVVALAPSPEPAR